MLEKKYYANGQQVYELKDNILTYYLKSGKVKAEGAFENEQMQGEWKFYRGSGELWQIAHFHDNMKHGSWIRFDRNGDIEYEANFENNKLISQKTK